MDTSTQPPDSAYQLLVEANPLPALLLNGLQVICANTVAGNTLGFSPVGKSISALFSARERALCTEAVESGREFYTMLGDTEYVFSPERSDRLCVITFRRAEFTYSLTEDDSFAAQLSNRVASMILMCGVISDKLGPDSAEAAMLVQYGTRLAKLAHMYLAKASPVIRGQIYSEDVCLLTEEFIRMSAPTLEKSRIRLRLANSFMGLWAYTDRDVLHKMLTCLVSAVSVELSLMPGEETFTVLISCFRSGDFVRVAVSSSADIPQRIREQTSGVVSSNIEFARLLARTVDSTVFYSCGSNGDRMAVASLPFSDEEPTPIFSDSSNDMAFIASATLYFSDILPPEAFASRK